MIDSIANDHSCAILMTCELRFGTCLHDLYSGLMVSVQLVHMEGTWKMFHLQREASCNPSVVVSGETILDGVSLAFEGMSLGKANPIDGSKG